MAGAGDKRRSDKCALANREMEKGGRKGTANINVLKEGAVWFVKSALTKKRWADDFALGMDGRGGYKGGRRGEWIGQKGEQWKSDTAGENEKTVAELKLREMDGMLRGAKVQRGLCRESEGHTKETPFTPCDVSTISVKKTKRAKKMSCYIFTLVHKPQCPEFPARIFEQWWPTFRVIF